MGQMILECQGLADVTLRPPAGSEFPWFQTIMKYKILQCAYWAETLSSQQEGADQEVYFQHVCFPGGYQLTVSVSTEVTFRKTRFCEILRVPDTLKSF